MGGADMDFRIGRMMRRAEVGLGSFLRHISAETSVPLQEATSAIALRDT